MVPDLFKLMLEENGYIEINNRSRDLMKNKILIGLWYIVESMANRGFWSAGYEYLQS